MKTWMCALMLALSTGASVQNPIISGQYSADPYGSRIQREGISLSFS